MGDHCLNCQNSDFTDYLLINKYNYKRCKTCGLVQLFPLPTLEDLYAFYNKDYYKKIGSNSNDISRISVIRSQTQIQYEIVKRNYVIERCTKFLDFGCGIGNFLDTLKENGIEFIKGYEFNPVSTKIVNDKGYHTIESLEQNSQKFDVITLWDVAEHLIDPVSTFKTLYKSLNIKGVLVIGTCRIDDFVDRTSNGYTMWADPPGHTILYSKKTLQMILKNSGFENNWIDNKHTISNIYNSKYQMFKRLVKKILFFSNSDKKNCRGDFGSYMVVISKK